MEKAQPTWTSFRQLFNLRTELARALLPTAIVLITLVFLDAFSNQHVLFTSLASSAFLIYLDPEHIMNRVRTLLIAQPLALLVGFAAQLLISSDYEAAALGMLVTILAMILLDAVHPPAVSTSLLFAFHDYSEQTLTLFGLALGMTVVLVALQQAVVWLARRYHRGWHHPQKSDT